MRQNGCDRLSQPSLKSLKTAAPRLLTGILLSSSFGEKLNTGPRKYKFVFGTDSVLKRPFLNFIFL